MDRTVLRETIKKYLSDQELRDLCTDLEADYESLPGEGKAAKARELIAYCERRSLVSKLEAVCRSSRKDVPWDEAFGIKSSAPLAVDSAVQAAQPGDAFADLQIRLFPRQAQAYRVEMVLNDEQVSTPGYLSSDILPWATSGNLAQDGRRLFDALFADRSLLAAWNKVRGGAPRCRIRLWVDVAAPELHTLPWELLQEGRAMLSADAETPFSRYLPAWASWGGAVKERPVRMLVVISNPGDLVTKYGLSPADIVQEKQILQAAVADVSQGVLSVEFLDSPVTLGRLEAALRGVHLLHFVGHGVFNTQNATSALLMQDETGNARRVLDEDLVGMLARQGAQPRMVFLAACQSAKRATADALSGLAPKLVSEGVPAVVAMQDIVTIETARHFSAEFYQRLSAHGQVDLAVNQARSALLTAGRSDAAVPVLFMRVKSGQLW